MNRAICRGFAGRGRLTAQVLLNDVRRSCAANRATRVRSRSRHIVLTGVGFFVNFDVDADAPRTEPIKNFTGGNVAIALEGVEHGAGCVLFVRDGVITMLEGYTYGAEAWPARPIVLALEQPCPLVSELPSRPT